MCVYRLVRACVSLGSFVTRFGRGQETWFLHSPASLAVPVGLVLFLSASLPATKVESFQIRLTSELVEVLTYIVSAASPAWHPCSVSSVARNLCGGKNPECASMAIMFIRIHILFLSGGAQDLPTQHYGGITPPIRTRSIYLVFGRHTQLKLKMNRSRELDHGLCLLQNYTRCDSLLIHYFPKSLNEGFLSSRYIPLHLVRVLFLYM